MASLKTVRENLDDLAENLHELYVEKDGKFILELEGIDDHPAVAGLKSALAAQKQARIKAVDDLKVLKDRLSKLPSDFNPEEYENLKTKLAEAEMKLEEYEADPEKRTTPDTKAAQEAVAARKMLEQRIVNMEKAHAQEVEKLRTQIKGKDTFISQLLIDDGLTKALVDTGVSKEYLKAAKALLRTDVKVIEENGAYQAIVETDAGTYDVPRYVADWVASDEGKAFVPPAKGGDAGGTQPKNQSKPITSGEKNPWSKENWNMTEQGRMIKADRVRAEKLAKAAGHKLPAETSAA